MLSACIVAKGSLFIHVISSLTQLKHLPIADNKSISNDTQPEKNHSTVFCYRLFQNQLDLQSLHLLIMRYITTVISDQLKRNVAATFLLSSHFIPTTVDTVAATTHNYCNLFNLLSTIVTLFGFQRRRSH